MMLDYMKTIEHMRSINIKNIILTMRRLARRHWPPNAGPLAATVNVATGNLLYAVASLSPTLQVEMNFSLNSRYFRLTTVKREWNF